RLDVLYVDNSGILQDIPSLVTTNSLLQPGPLVAGQVFGDESEEVVIGFDKQSPLIGSFNGNNAFYFQPISFLPAGKTVVLGDINGDGLADIGVFDSNTGFHYAIQDQSGSFTVYNTNVGPFFNIVSAAMLVDVNGDFKPDLVFTSGGN